MSAAIMQRFRECFEHQRFAELAELYADDATFELNVGAWRDQRKGPDSIVARYSEDYNPPPTFIRWDGRVAPWGAVVEGDAVQGEGPRRTRYRWVHILTIDQDRIVDDTVYCTGAFPFPGTEGADAAPASTVASTGAD